MAKRRTQEKSRSQVNLSRVPSRRSVFAIFLPWFLVIAALIAAFATIPLDTSIPIVSAVAKKTPRNFGLMSQTEKWIGRSLILTSLDGSFDLEQNLQALKSNKNFSFGISANSVRLKIKSLNEIVFPVFGLSNPWQAFGKQEIVRGFDFDRETLYNIMSSEILPKVNRLSQNAILEIEGKRAVKLRPDIIGQSLDIKAAELTIRQALFQNRAETALPIIITPPEVRLADTNDLGIRELVATGESDFTGSSQSRITNIKVGAERFNGVILAPGEEFSFNNNLGPITAAEGYKPELVIKSTGTVPELGGGLCQVSTTAFRAAFYGGLPITARKNHSYAVSYYSPQGTDATIYPGIVDFKFRNDTPRHLLIATRVEGNKLYFDFYGTKDSREVSIDGPYQYDFTPDGASRARLSRTVTVGEEEVKDDFYSRYVSRNRFPVSYEYPKAPENPENVNSDESDEDESQKN